MDPAPDGRSIGLRARLGGRTPRSLVRAFAWRSAAVFIVVGLGLHVIVSTVVTDHFRGAAAFHAEFVGHAVLEPLLAEMSRFDEEAAPADKAELLRTYAIDDHVVQILIWDPDGTVLAADDASLVGASAPGYLAEVAFDERGHAHPLDGEGAPSAPPGGAVVDGALRSFVTLDLPQPRIAEILQDPAQSVEPARGLTRLIDLGVVVGLLLLWALLLPIARRAARDLDRRATTDELTELLNRSALSDQLREVARRNVGAGSCVAVLFIDLDGFKSINDAGGHVLGDEVLRQVSRRLRDEVRPNDAVARFAGDEFVVILDQLHGPEVAIQIAHRILAAVREPFDGAGPHRLTASVGLSVARADTVDVDELVRDADAAMYHVKTIGGDAVRVFDEDLRQLVQRQLWIDRELRGAADRGEMHLVFQPFVALSGDAAGTVVAAEALLRWTHPTAGPIGPGEFIPIAERNGVLHELGPWVFREACAALVELQGHLAEDHPFTLYVNLSPVQLRDDLVDRLDHCIEEHGIDPQRVGFEVTETAILHEGDTTAIGMLTALRDRGCTIAVDDFGTGYSSLGRLRTLPIDLIKLDASFVHSLAEDRRELAITTAVAGLAQRLGMSVLAEGIETSDQLFAVRELGFDLAQGYHLARPGPLEQLLALLPPQARRARAAETDLATSTSR